MTARRPRRYEPRCRLCGTDLPTDPAADRYVTPPASETGPAPERICGPDCPELSPGATVVMRRSTSRFPNQIEGVPV